MTRVGGNLHTHHPPRNCSEATAARRAAQNLDKTKQNLHKTYMVPCQTYINPHKKQYKTNIIFENTGLCLGNIFLFVLPSSSKMLIWFPLSTSATPNSSDQGCRSIRSDRLGPHGVARPLGNDSRRKAKTLRSRQSECGQRGRKSQR